MRKGYALQVETLAKMRRAGEIRVETLAQSGEWFRRNFEVTPATAVVATEDWKNQGRKSVWYDSRFYRVNFLWEGDAFFIRDLQLFDERVASPTHDVAMKTTALAYETLPVMDGARGGSNGVRAGVWPVIFGEDGKETGMLVVGEPEISQGDGNALVISEKLKRGGEIEIVCEEKAMKCKASDALVHPLKWGWELRGDEQMRDAFGEVAAGRIDCQSGETKFGIRVTKGLAQREDGIIRLVGDSGGMVSLEFGAD
jgi:hypothetical protein